MLLEHSLTTSNPACSYPITHVTLCILHDFFSWQCSPLSIHQKLIFVCPTLHHISRCTMDSRYQHTIWAGTQCDCKMETAQLPLLTDKAAQQINSTVFCLHSNRYHWSCGQPILHIIHKPPPQGSSPKQNCLTHHAIAKVATPENTE